MRLFPAVVVFVLLAVAWPGAQGGYGAAAGLKGGYDALDEILAERQGRLAPVSATGAILIFGGDHNATFLGCLNCGELNTNSVRNALGPFGSSLSGTSIYNKLGQFGSTLSSYSPCNDLASHPPVLVDDAGKFYGELTTNTVRPKRIHAPSINAWLGAMCHADD